MEWRSLRSVEISFDFLLKIVWHSLFQNVLVLEQNANVFEISKPLNLFSSFLDIKCVRLEYIKNSDNFYSLQTFVIMFGKQAICYNNQFEITT